MALNTTTTTTSLLFAHNIEAQEGT